MFSKAVTDKFLFDKIKKQPELIKKRLCELEEKDAEYFQLKVIKKQRAYPEIGDIFAVNPIDDFYFWGIVVNNHIDNSDGDDLLVVMIFDEKIKILDTGEFVPNFNNLLINPCIVGPEYWTKGLFYKIGNVKDIQFPKYGFFDTLNDRLYDEYGKRLWKSTPLLGLRGVYTIVGVGYEIYCELIIRGYI